MRKEAFEVNLLILKENKKFRGIRQLKMPFCETYVD